VQTPFLYIKKEKYLLFLHLEIHQVKKFFAFQQ
jgi:hypothetical protein